MSWSLEKSRWWDMGSWHVWEHRWGDGDYDPCHLMCAFWLALLTLVAHVISGGHAFSD